MDLFISPLIKFWYTIAIVFIMGRFIYYANKGKKEYLFTCTLVAAIISLICILVSQVELSLGFAIGIFALFGIISFRTTPISPREMTYIFLSTGIAVKNTLAPQDLESYIIFASDISLLLLAGLLEYFLFREKFSTKIMDYNNQVLPTRGIYWNNRSTFNYSLSSDAHTYNQLASDFSFFLSFRKPYRAVIAFRVGGALNIGDYEFFQANSEGGKENLRGHRSTRYSGDANAYQNTELRFKLFNFSTYIAKGEAGIMGFNDFGRVWLDGEDSRVWHHGAGGGLWLSPFRLAVLNATWEWSKDEPSGLFTFRFRFLF